MLLYSSVYTKYVLKYVTINTHIFTSHHMWISLCWKSLCLFKVVSAARIDVGTMPRYNTCVGSLSYDLNTFKYFQIKPKCLQIYMIFIKHSFFAWEGHPEFSRSKVSSFCLHNQLLLSKSSLKILFLKYFVLIAWSCVVTIVLPSSPLLLPKFSYL
jgi:hypothetical protein